MKADVCELHTRLAFAHDGGRRARLNAANKLCDGLLRRFNMIDNNDSMVGYAHEYKDNSDALDDAPDYTESYHAHQNATFTDGPVHTNINNTHADSNNNNSNNVTPSRAVAMGINLPAIDGCDELTLPNDDDEEEEEEQQDNARVCMYRPADEKKKNNKHKHYVSILPKQNKKKKHNK